MDVETFLSLLCLHFIFCYNIVFSFFFFFLRDRRIVMVGG